MQHSVILKRENGDRVNIQIDLYVKSFGNDLPQYRVSVLKSPNKKRNWTSLDCGDDFQWRRLDGKEKDAYQMNIYLQHVTKEEIYAAKLELWQLIKPANETNP